MSREVHLYTSQGTDSSFPGTCHSLTPTSPHLPHLTHTHAITWLLVEQFLAHSNGRRN